MDGHLSGEKLNETVRESKGKSFTNCHTNGQQSKLL